MAWQSVLTFAKSRRIKADFTVLENHIGTEARSEITGKPENEVTAEKFPDSVGIGSYRIDLHPSTGGNNYIDIGSLPFEIPLGALIPERMEKPAAGLQKYWDNPHYKRLLSTPSG